MKLRVPEVLFLFTLGALCGLLAAIGGPIVEALLAVTGVFRYADDSDALFGVAPWLPALYFSFGVVVALLAEIAAKDRQPSVRLSGPGIAAPR